MKTIFTLIALLFCYFQPAAQNLQFISECENIEVATAIGSCEAQVFFVANATSDDSCNIGTGVISYSYSLTINEGNNTTQINDSGNELNINLPAGNHLIRFTALDACTGLAATCSFNIYVKDLEKPVAVFLPGVSTIPMPQNPGGFINFYASDFDLDSRDNCSDQNKLRFSFSDNTNDRTLIRTCNDATGLPEYLTIYVFDEQGNYATSEVGLLLASCPNTTQASAEICLLTEDGEKITKATINTSCQATVEEINSCYNLIFMNPAMCEIRPVKDINPLNGVSTFDLIKISKHIIGVELLDSPYKMLAADVNNSRSITTFDIVTLRKLILFQISSFPNNTSWRFVPESFDFPNPANPFAGPLPEVAIIGGTPTFPLSLDFIGFKVGDVNVSAVPHAFDSELTDDRTSNEPLHISILDQEVTAGETYTVNFAARDFHSVAGFQMALQFDTQALRFENIQTTGRLDYMDSACFGLTLLNEGIIPVSWNTFEGLELADGEAIFSIQFSALQSGKLNNMLSLHSVKLSAEAYQEDANGLNLLNIELDFEIGQMGSDEFLVEVAKPNPFEELTTINLTLPGKSQVGVEVYDAVGKLIIGYQADMEAGPQEIQINGEMLPANGLYYYKIETAFGNATGSIIKH